MADVEGDVQNVAWLEAAIESAVVEKRAEGVLGDIEAPGIVDIAIVGAGGLASVGIAGLGVWKLAELII